jgi:hypothetical protein
MSPPPDASPTAFEDGEIESSTREALVELKHLLRAHEKDIVDLVKLVTQFSQRLAVLEQPSTMSTLPQTTPQAPLLEPTRSRIRPGIPPDFDGSRATGRAFITCCHLYISLLSRDFADDQTKIHWVLSHFKSGRAANFAVRTLKFEEARGKPRYENWATFVAVFDSVFCIEDPGTTARMILESEDYFQGKRTFDAYMDEFHDLVDASEYTDWVAIVLKFRRGLEPIMQDRIAESGAVCLSTSSPEDWYDAARCFDRNRTANRAFHGSKLANDLSQPASTVVIPPAPPTIPSKLPYVPTKVAIASRNRYADLFVEVARDEPEVTPLPRPTPSRPVYIRRAAWERRLPDRYVIAATSDNSIHIQVEIETTTTCVKRSTSALIDSGATGLFMDTEYARANDIPTRSLSRPIPVFNVDGTANEAGSIDAVAEVILRYNGHIERAIFAITSLGKQSIILGFPWLRKHNPTVNWETKEIRMERCPSICNTCRSENKSEKTALRATAEAIRACRAGPFPVLIEEIEDEDAHPREGTSNPEGGVNSDDEIPGLREEHDGKDDTDYDNTDIEDDDRIFVAHVHPEDPEHFVRAFQTVSQRLSEAFTKNSKPKTFRDVVPDSFHDFEDVFNEHAFDSLPERRKWDHAIELEREPSPGFRKVYPMTLDEQAEMDTFLEEALRTGRIRPSKSPIGAPVFFIKKKDGKLRFIQDYRALNLITRKNRYPLPLIDDLIHRLKDAKYFSKFDVRWGYNNVRIKEGDEWKAAFRTNRGLFEPLVMYFGLTNSPATFQTMMNEIFADLIALGVVSVYMDDILIFTSTREEHCRITRIVLERLRKEKLYLRAEKCEFEKEQIEYLGVIISHNRVAMDPVKVAGVSEWPIPVNKKEVQSFVGFINFYRRFIPNFSHHARALFDLTMKDVRFVWASQQVEAFAKLKELVTSKPVLVLPDNDRPFRLSADGSGFATGAVLEQQSREDEKWHPIAFLSKALNSVERNYEIHDTEMLAIIRGLEEWRHLLEGARHPVEIWTDHKNLEYFRVAQKLNRRQARWSLYLSRFDFTLHHKPGKSMGKPDALSRRSDHGTGASDNNNITLLTPEQFRVHALTGLDIVGEEKDILKEIRRSLRDDEQEEPVAKAARELRKTKGRSSVRSAEWSEGDSLLMFRGRIYVPKDRDLRRRIVEQHHDSLIAGHAGRFKTLELVSRNYWWPQMSRYIGTYCRTCDLCNRTKTQHRKPIGELHPAETPEERWDVISVDFIVELPESNGYDTIMNVVDSVGKRAHFVATNTTITAEGSARLYVREVWKHHGTPRTVLSDRGPQFVADFTRELYRLLGIKLALSTAYHPQTDGQTERLNQELEQYLRLFVNERQDNWDDLLPFAEFEYNNHVHSSTQQTPFMVDTGRHPRMGFEPQQPRSKITAVSEFADRMAKGLSEARAALTKSKDEYAMYYNRRREPAPDLKPGDRVWLDASDIRTTRPSSKLSHRRLGPYEIESKVGHGAYRLKLPFSLGRLHPVFPIVKLTVAIPDPIPGRKPVPPPDPILIKGVQEYEVEEVLDSRMRWNRLEYFVKWKGYDASHNCWEVFRDVHAPVLVAQFHRDHPAAPRRINAASFDSITFSKADCSTSWRSKDIATHRRLPPIRVRDFAYEPALSRRVAAP